MNKTSPNPLQESEKAAIRFPAEIAALIAKFAKDEIGYSGKQYKEMSLRTDYLNPVFEALGWDIQNRKSSNFTEREVILEYPVKSEGGDKSPDFAFLVEGRRKFFVEAKRPSINVEEDKIPAYQIRRYCWSADLPFGIVTDFQEWAIYDCRAIPDLKDSTHVGRILYFSYDELPQHWNFLQSLFGRDEVNEGSIEAYAETAKPPVGTRAIDEALLDEIRGWRSDLAKDLAITHPNLGVAELNFIVQTLIDRLIFLRIAEARGLEELGALKKTLVTEGSVYKSLMKVFQRADDRYNSGLFHTSKSAPRNYHDLLFPDDLQVSSELIGKIIRRLYEPEPYEFSVVPPDILGRIYEQFLGETIHIEKNRSTKIVMKPEVRKAGGVYYTPQTIVEFIVERTLGPVLDGKTPEQVSKISVLDPACGSGSFLISALQYLFDWHVNYYAKRPKLAAKYLETKSGERHRSQKTDRFRLSTVERKRILLNNIYGVDIDRQAVEVTKLSLLLKLIEGESQHQLEVGQLLPDLDATIRCGNSLIASDFLSPFVQDDNELNLVNPFDWKDSFPKVFANGGFDVIIGNPPYLNIDSVWGSKDPRLAYIKANYNAVYTDKTDILFYFLKKSIDICKGEISFIISRSFLEANKAQKLRGWLSRNARVREITDFREAHVFPKVGINTAVINLTHSDSVKSTKLRRYKRKTLPPGYSVSFLKNEKNFKSVHISSKELSNNAWNFGDEDVRNLLSKIDLAGPQIGDILSVGKGMETGANSVFEYFPDDRELKQLIKQNLIYRRARNSDISKYFINENGPFYLFLEDVIYFKDVPKEVQLHLQRNSGQLKNRAAYKRGDCQWWKYTWPLHLEKFDSDKIFCPYRASDNRFCIDVNKEFLGVTDTTILYNNGQEESLKYFVGLLNSRILSVRFKFIAKLLSGGVYEYYENTVRQLPIPRLQEGNVDLHRIVELVDICSEAKAGMTSTHITHEMNQFQKSYENAINEIDQIACKLYGISTGELESLEEASKH